MSNLPDDWLSRCLEIAAYLAIPIAWGWMVNALFDRINHHSPSAGGENQSPLTDYHI